MTSATGAAAAGKPVDLYAWPSDAVLSALKPGSMVPTMLLARATTNSAGQYTLRVLATRLKRVAVEAGWANLEVYSPGGGIWFVSVQADTQPSEPVTVDLSGKNKWPCGYDSRGNPYGFSGFTYLRPRAPVNAIVGQGYIVPSKGTAGDSVTFDYTRGSSHAQASSLGVGISGFGLNAGYSSSGTHSSTAHRTVRLKAQPKTSLFRTMFHTGEFRGECYGLPYRKVPRAKMDKHSPCPKKYQVSYVHRCLWMVQSMGWAGGASILHPKASPKTPASDCFQYPAGTVFESDFGVAIEWSKGFELGAGLNIKGVNLKASFSGSAQTGYDTEAYMSYYLNKGNQWLCGTNGDNNSAAVLVLRDNKP